MYVYQKIFHLLGSPTMLFNIHSRWKHFVGFFKYVNKVWQAIIDFCIFCIDMYLPKNIEKIIKSGLYLYQKIQKYLQSFAGYHEILHK